MAEYPIYLSRGRGRGIPTTQLKENNNNLFSHHKPFNASNSNTNSGNEITQEARNKLDLEDRKSEEFDILTHEMLEQALTLNHISCIICLVTIASSNPIWTCVNCFDIFHLSCIQSWSRTNTNNNNNNNNNNKNKITKPISWNCPKCLHSYKLSEIPSVYTCFCKRIVNPKFDPWLVPHSCGQKCDRQLPCAHKCSILCHPGKCPPCPKTVNTVCHCQKNRRVQRCGKPIWSCGNTCDKLLSCQTHKCSMTCHSGVCSPCNVKQNIFCQCGKKSFEVACGQHSINCEKNCNKILSCGQHRCEKICHPKGDCGVCPRTLPRSCPCGKELYTLSCLEDPPNCKNTCNKLLNCGNHACMERCHNEECPPCRQIIEKTCRCSDKRKSLPCGESFLCDLKCKKMRNCTRHQCKRKCCDGICLPCQEVCNRNLNCRKHKCQAPCHPNTCYPCVKETILECPCKGTRKRVLCGEKIISSENICKKPCQKQCKCHHSKIQAHTCHIGECPSCTLTCNKSLELCSHTCQNICHTVPQMKRVESILTEGPWKQKKYTEELIVTNCGHCHIYIDKTCLGGHETKQQFCFEKCDYSCERSCGRLLNCSHHNCILNCHKLTDTHDNTLTSIECEQCTRPCGMPRPKGCTHKCNEICHVGTCEQCDVLLRFKCHCDSIDLYFTCTEWLDVPENERNDRLVCLGRCCRKMGCGHRCPKKCHFGPCPDSTSCLAKVTFYCSCKRIKVQKPCFEVQEVEFNIFCDEICIEQSLQNVRENIKKSPSFIIKRENLTGKRIKKRNKPLINEEIVEINSSKYGHYLIWEKWPLNLIMKSIYRITKMNGVRVIIFTMLIVAILGLVSYFCN